MIEVNRVSKVYRIKKKKGGLTGSISSFLRPEISDVWAVKDISFQIDQGERVGFIGPNGSGKSTTIKMLVGILHPSSGGITINGISPQQNRQSVVKNIGVVFGQRSQLNWDLRLGESFELLKRIYRIEDMEYNTNIGLLSDVLQIDQLIDIPVRQLSLGQRMRGELVAAMLHSPKILLLDEPTIGLDIEVKKALKEFIISMNEIYGLTVLLTTHELDGISDTCDRVIVINNGRIIEDSQLNELIKNVLPYRFLQVECVTPLREIDSKHVSIERKSNDMYWIKYFYHEISSSELIGEVLKNNKITDLTIQEPKIEEIVRAILKRS